jgi:hypothetical protein
MKRLLAVIAMLAGLMASGMPAASAACTVGHGCHKSLAPVSTVVLVGTCRPVQLAHPNRLVLICEPDWVWNLTRW